MGTSSTPASERGWPEIIGSLIVTILVALAPIVSDSDHGDPAPMIAPVAPVVVVVVVTTSNAETDCVPRYPVE